MIIENNWLLLCEIKTFCCFTPASMGLGIHGRHTKKAYCWERISGAISFLQRRVVCLKKIEVAPQLTLKLPTMPKI